MTSFRIEHIHGIARVNQNGDARLGNWPVVYVLAGSKQVYVGESLNVRNRFSQHLKSPNKQGLDTAYIVLDDSFNKSAALDLESHLVRYLVGDDRFTVINRNNGIIDADYFDRAEYRKRFGDVFDQLRELGIFQHSIAEIESSDLFKLSPYKALNADQEQVIQSYLSDLLGHLKAGATSLAVVEGDPGTGKTIVGVYLMKLLIDLARTPEEDEVEDESIVNDPFIAEHRHLLEDLEIGLVVPQQSLRDSIKRVFKKTPGLSSGMVMTPFQVGESEKHFDLLVVDETHRLNHRANQPSGPGNKKFAEINTKLFGADDVKYTQADWVRAKSDHQVFLLDVHQSVKPADLPFETVCAIATEADATKSLYPLTSQMRVQAGGDYIKYLREVFSDGPPEPKHFPDYDLRWFEDLRELELALDEKESEVGLARMLAGFAFKWVSRDNPSAIDFDIDGVRRQWNTTQTDWVRSPGAAQEVGVIHTIQGYDLNYAGVIIGKDLRRDPEAGRLYFDRTNYFDKKGVENNRKLGIEYSDEDILRYIVNVYVVLLTRGVRGTFVYVCDPGLREYLRPFFTTSNAKPLD
jgi:DUF2075 family protein